MCLTAQCATQGTGKASYYADNLRNHLTANGERYDPKAFTAANKTLPFGTCVLVTLDKNGKSVMVRINDRGPYIVGRYIDLSRAAAEQIGMTSLGVGAIHYKILGKTQTKSCIQFFDMEWYGGF